MKIIGICGQSGSGKSTFAALFKKRNIPVLDCDKIYHSLINSPTPCLDEIGERFGKNFTQDGVLDRKALGKIVFNDSDLLKELNRITHRYVLDELLKYITQFKSESKVACVIDAPMLFEAGLEKWCDVVCCVVASKERQMDRICRRDHITKKEAEIRISNQMESDDLLRKCTVVVYNNGDISELDRKCNQILNQLNLLHEGDN